jgi:hypothetical protein
MPSRDFVTVSSLIDDLEVISESDFRIIAHSQKHDLLYHEWLESSLDIDDDIFRSESLYLFKIVEQYLPTFFLVNDKKRKTSISEETQEFLVVNFQPLYAHPKMRKVALISNEELSIQGQAESTMEDVDKGSISNTTEFAFFIDVSQGIEWLGI